MDTRTGGEIAATDQKPAAVHADGYDTRDIRPASRENRKPDGDDRDDGGYIHREIMPQGNRADSRGNPPPGPCFDQIREADFAAPPCYR